ncbi:uroporphyrinogen-III C-methyltransferase [Pelistega europaea]|uniref:Uncharacterized protein n=1 Tax=Pelistega europaea TaxID=106147 RepID=A0A7Y4LC94_9BURK|nr:uroporphyrinogen-III C-methyltransferase [Pelistega europaea]NOL49631.1 hypothetical protein [Pelistega europaea]
MTQRHKYRTGRRVPRQRQQHKDVSVSATESTLSNPISHQQGSGAMKENEPLVQVETHQQDSSATSELAKVALEGFVATSAPTKKVENSIESSTESLNSEQEKPCTSDKSFEAETKEQLSTEAASLETAAEAAVSHFDEQKIGDDGQDDSTSTDTAGTSKKGNVGKSVMTIVALAALIGGGYYYAKEQGFIGSSESVVSNDNTSADSASADNADKANMTAGSESTPENTTSSSASTASDSSATSTASDSSAAPTASDSSAASTASDSSATSTASDSSAAPTASDSSAASTASDSSTTSTASDSSATSTASDSSAASTASDSSATSTASDSSAAPTASDSSAQPSADADNTTPPPTGSDNTASTTSAGASTEVANTPASDASVASLSAALKQQEQQIAQLTEQLKAAQAAMADQQVKSEQQQALRQTLHNLTQLYQSADFERTVRVSKENTLKALAVLESTLALQSGDEWKAVRLAVEQDIDTLKASTDVNLDKLFQATKGLSELLKVAPFVSAESGQGVIVPVESSEIQETNAATPAETTSWLDKAINHVEKFSGDAYNAIRSDLGGLIKVEKLSNPEVALMSVEQVQQLREETLRQLSIAQEALLKRQQTIWAEAMQKVEHALTTYYNTNVDVVQQAVALAHQLAGTSVASQLPDLQRTQQALEQLARQLRLDN